MKRKKVTGLSSREIELVSHFELNRQSIVTAGDVRKILHCSKQRAFEIISRLKRKGRLVKIKREKYVFLPLAAVDMNWSEHPFIIASELLDDYYISYYTALNFHGFTEQVPIVVYIACLRYRKPVKLFGAKFSFIQLKKNKFFGCEKIKINNEWINIADKEKTIIDCLDKQKYCGGIKDVFNALRNKKIDYTKLFAYAIRMKNKTLIKRLGYLLGLLKINKSRELLKYINDKKYVRLSALHENRGSIDKKWKIIKNISEKELAVN